MNTKTSASKVLTIVIVASLLAALSPGLALEVKAAPTELFFSEYVEGSSYNKTLEIYNGTGGTITFSGQYTLELYSNGSSSVTASVALEGSVADGDVFVIAHPSAAQAILDEADQLSGSVVNFNGDDAVALLHDAATIDVIGQIGFDPGSEWGSGDASTKDNTLRRKDTIEAGDPDGSDPFDPSVEWDGYPQDTFDGLGAHGTSGPDYTSIYDIQYTTDPSGDSPYKDQTGVTTEGVVTARFQYGYFIEDPAGGAWNGLWVHDDTNTPDLGDRLRLTGTVKEYYNLTELDELTDYQVESTGNTIPDPEVLATGDVSQEQWEGVLVRVESVTVTDPDLGFGEWSVDDGSGDVIIDDKGDYTYTPVLSDTIDAIIGPLDYHHDAFKIQPRDDADILLPAAVEVIVTEIMQNPAAVGDTDGEWFEIYNAGDGALDLQGWTFHDLGSNTFTVDASLLIQPGEYLVLGRDGDSATNGGVEVDYVYGSDMSLANGDDEIIVEDADAVEIDRVEYDGGPVWPDPTGASMMLIDLALDNNDGANWQETPADLTYGDGDRGTPGCPNTGCPSSDVTPIYDIQYTTDPGGDGTYPSLLAGQTVTTTGVVYATYAGRGFCIADGDGPWHGVYVYYPDGALPEVGDEVQVVGEVQEYYGLTELGNYATYDLLSSGNTPHGPSIVTAAEIAFDDNASEPYESVFVELYDIEVTAGADSYGIWSFTDASSGTGKADDWGYHLEPNVGDAFDILRGALIYDFSEYKVMPRDADDVTAFPQIVITEIMQNPAAVGDTDGEWFEIYNAGGTQLDLNGWTFHDLGSNTFTVDASLLIQPGEYLVLGRDGDSATNGGVEVDYVYGSDMSLANGDDEIIVEDADAVEIDRVEYDGGPVWPDPTGASMMLIDLALDNNDGANWQETPADLTYGDGDRGTPGCPNTGCPWVDVSIPEIQGVSFTSSYSGTVVRTTGVVVGTFEGNLPSGGGVFDGFYLQDTAGDGDPATSDGVLVNHGTLNVSVNVGDLVTVIGEVQEFNEYGDPPPETETQVYVSSGGDVMVTGSAALPAAVELDPPGDPEAAQSYFEAREGMLTSLGGDSPVVGPTSFGTIFVVPESAGVDRVMRGSAHEGKPFGVRRSQRYGSGGPNLIVGSVVTNVDGPLAYTYGNYVVITQPGDDLQVLYEQPLPADPPTWPAAATDELTVGSFNTYNFDSTGTELIKVADTIDAMGGPLLLGLQEIAVSSVMTDLLTNLSGLGYDYDFAYSHPDVGDHGVALLWRTDRVADVDWSTDYQACSDFGSESSTEYDSYCEGTGLFPLFSRRPVVATTTVTLEGYPHQVIVIANHFKSKRGGAPADQRRLEQAQFVAGLVDQFVAADPEANVVVVGDLNDFLDSPPLDALTASGNLTDTFYSLSPEERYSYIFNGVSQVLDHILTSPHLSGGLEGFGPLHTNADYPFNPYNGDPDVIWRTSDHDPLASTFRLEPPVAPLEGVQLGGMAIKWDPSGDGRGKFYLEGEFQLPTGYTQDDLSGELALSLTIADVTGSETFTFTRYDDLWLYKEKGELETGLQVHKATILWSTDGATLIASGEMNLPGVNQNTEPAQATVRMSFPVPPPSPAAELVGEIDVSFWVYDNLWVY